MRSVDIRAAERTAAVLKLRADGVSGAAIAERLGISENSVFARVTGARGNRLHEEWSAERIEKLKALWSEGLTARQIAAHFGDISRSAVLGKVHRLRLPTRADCERAPPTDRTVKNKKVRIKFSPEEQRERDRLAKELRRRAKGIMPRGDRPAPVVVPALPPLHIAFIETTRDNCRWICSEAGAPVTVCGHQTVSDGSWCTHHTSRVFQPRPPADGLHRLGRHWSGNHSARWTGHA
jgi:GcrA cell cycle regulator